MIDMLYVIATIGFFALMLAFVRGCEKLGASTDAVREPDHGTVQP